MPRLSFACARGPAGVAAAIAAFTWSVFRRNSLTVGMAVTVYGVCALTFMMTMYGLESRGRRFVLAFALGCALSSLYGFLSGAWPFGVVELIWSGVAVRRFQTST